MQWRSDSVVLCGYCGSAHCKIYTEDKKITWCPWLQKPQWLKNTLALITQPHWPRQAASPFTPPVWPSGWQLLWSKFLRNCAQMPKACVKLIQSHRLYGWSTSLLQRPGSREMVRLWSMITLLTQQMGAEIGTRLWTRVEAPLQSAAALYWRRGECGCTLMAIRWISSRAPERPLSRSGENESRERISQSFPQGRRCLATF